MAGSRTRRAVVTFRSVAFVVAVQEHKSTICSNGLERKVVRAWNLMGSEIDRNEYDGLCSS